MQYLYLCLYGIISIIWTMAGISNLKKMEVLQFLLWFIYLRKLCSRMLLIKTSNENISNTYVYLDLGSVGRFSDPFYTYFE